ncbi:MAG: hypothetical protein HYR55_03570 [Acidobacteria bacterium]|nr:hypothetical protein [Acidobacteriota bacterium]MBI3656921.1 hypothetical protein [Acidobacteriota bacterium]
MLKVKTAVVLISLVLSPAVALRSQSKPSTPPGPVKYISRFNVVWNTITTVLTEMGLKIESVDRGSGHIATKPYEFITGSLSASELGKLAAPPEVYNNVGWIKGRYVVEVIAEIVQGNESMVTVRVSPQGLKRDLSGKDEWVDWRSNGSIERRLLGRLSVKLLSPVKADDKKGFWDQPVQSIPRPNENPKLSSPQRDKP